VLNSLLPIKSGVKIYKLSDLLAPGGSSGSQEVTTIQTLAEPQHVSFNSDGSLIAVYTESSSGKAVHIYNILMDQVVISCLLK